MFKNKKNNDIISNNCRNIFNPKKIISIPSPVNLPTKENSVFFNTGGNIKNNLKYKITGKYCFPIPKFTYDGVWDNKIISKQKLQKRKWFINKNIPTNGIYCGNEFLIFPKKTIKIGDSIYSPEENCNKFYPDVKKFDKNINKCTKKFRCNENDCFDKTGLIKLTNGKWNINGI